VCTNLKYNGETSNDPDEIADIFANFYSDVYSPTENDSFDNDFKSEVESDIEILVRTFAEGDGCLPSGDIEISEIENAIQNLKLQKAPGHDKVQNEHLRYC